MASLELHRIVRPPTRRIGYLAFEPKDVERRHALLSALVTPDSDSLVLVFVGHRGQGNVLVNLVNEEVLVGLVYHHLFTQRTAPLARF